MILPHHECHEPLDSVIIFPVGRSDISTRPTDTFGLLLIESPVKWGTLTILDIVPTVICSVVAQ